VLRHTQTTYRFDSAYINNRIIGLVDTETVYGATDSHVISKTRYDYDWGNEHMVDTSAQPVQHDPAYNLNYLAGRGNLVLIAQFDASDPNNGAKTHEFKLGYNTSGSVTFTRDALWHVTSFDYTDAFADGVNRNTFAYQTKITDPDGFNTTSQYNFDFGGVTQKQTPSPNSGQAAPYTTILYDSVGRITEAYNSVNGATQEWVYPLSHTYVQYYENIDQNYNVAYSWQVFDGAGRVRGIAGDHYGSVGGYRGQYITYDNMGRQSGVSNPLEINNTWVPQGDDANATWLYTTQTYDYNGRPLVTTNTDGSQRQASYGGCGCAGGDVTTVTDERGRQKRYTNDVLGRLVKTEELNWDGSIYATTSFSYTYDTNTNLEKTIITQAQGTNQSPETRTLVYDGYGRVYQRITPEQGMTTYNYNNDDTINYVTDARGAKLTYGYNNRHMVTSLTYDTSSAPGVTPTSNVTFGYDPAGNRTSMNDGFGSVTYVYDQLSRMTSETRTFNGVGSFQISYGYNVGGELTSITNPWGSQVLYNRDRTGRIQSVTGAGAVSASTYASNLAYRATNRIKSLVYGNSRTLSVNYDNRLRPSQWNVSGVLGSNYNYDYFGEKSGRVTYAQNLYDSTLDHSYDYDQVGRLAAAYTGSEARAHIGQGQWGTQDGPYAESYSYDVWGNITQLQGWVSGASYVAFGASYSTGKNQRDGFTYDAAGNLTNDTAQQFTYDATGQQTSATWGGYSLQQGYDGNTLRVQKNENGTVTYYLRSTVLGGQTIAEISGGTWTRGYVYMGHQLLAVQQSGSVSWVHTDPVTKSQRVTDASGNVISTVEMDPWGRDSSRSNNGMLQPQHYTSYIRDGNSSDEAMMRRYNRWHSRFDQPDPFDGSYGASNPQSFNRYAYTQNDPVNFVDPSGLCSFDIAISNNKLLKADQLTAMKNEISRIFGTAGVDINFVNSNADYYLSINAKGENYTTNPDAVGITYLSPDGSRVQNNGRVFVDRLTNSAKSNSQSATAFDQSSNALAIGLGRAGAHEIGHYLLQQNFDSANIQGVMHNGFSGDQWFATTTQNLWTFSDLQKLILRARCHPSTVQTQVTPLANQISYIGGGGNGGGYVGGGYPGWWYSMWAFVGWVNSITVGGYDDEGPWQPAPTTPPKLKFAK
jgi:RHS repeat-associated protein